MAYDEGLAQILREALAGVGDIQEKKMFGGMAFMLGGNMLCGVHKDGAMFRVGKENEAAALLIKGARPMGFTKRPMGGMVDVSDEAIANDDTRDRLMGLALDFVRTLPAK